MKGLLACELYIMSTLQPVSDPAPGQLSATTAAQRAQASYAAHVKQLGDARKTHRMRVYDRAGIEGKDLITGPWHKANLVRKQEGIMKGLPQEGETQSHYYTPEELDRQRGHMQQQMVTGNNTTHQALQIQHQQARIRYLEAQMAYQQQHNQQPQSQQTPGKKPARSHSMPDSPIQDQGNMQFQPSQPDPDQPSSSSFIPWWR